MLHRRHPGRAELLKPRSVTFEIFVCICVFFVCISIFVFMCIFSCAFLFLCLCAFSNVHFYFLLCAEFVCFPFVRTLMWVFSFFSFFCM
jgi:sterol desaturase/sphingolipid hydroxylase (fatty acid hydroxylase superfamily)